MDGATIANFDAVKDDVKAEIRALLQERARRQRNISYSDLVAGVKSFTLTVNDPRLYRLLEAISIEEDEAGRGMMSVLVVHKHDGQPGDGFFALARTLGRTVNTERARLKLVAEETRSVFDACRKGK